MKVIDKVAPAKTKRINSQEQFDGEISEKLIIRDKLFKKYQKSRIHENEYIYKIVRYNMQHLICALAENQTKKHDTKLILKNFLNFDSNLKGNLLMKFPCRQIDIQLILSVSIIKKWQYLKLSKLIPTSEDV